MIGVKPEISADEISAHGQQFFFAFLLWMKLLTFKLQIYPGPYLQYIIRIQTLRNMDLNWLKNSMRI